MKIRFFTNIPSPYRMDFFDLLGYKVDLEVIFEAERANEINEINEKWYNKNQFKHLNTVFLKNGMINERRVNFQISKYVNKKVDLLIFSNYSYFTEMYAIIIAKLKKINYALEIDGGIINEDEKKIKKLLKRFLIKGASLYISPSNAADVFLKYYGADENKIVRYQFTSLKTKDFNRNIDFNDKANFKKELGISEHKMILSIGRFIESKGFDWLIDTYKKLDKNIGVYIVGGEPTKEFVDLKKKYVMDNLHFIDFLEKEEIIKWYQAADLFVLPTRSDIWGLVINESLSFGTPVITTSKCVAGLELIIDGYNGFIIEVEDRNKLLYLTNLFFDYNDDTRRKIFNNCRNTMNDYTIEKMADRHFDIIKDFLDKHVYK